MIHKKIDLTAFKTDFFGIFYNNSHTFTVIPLPTIVTLHPITTISISAPTADAQTYTRNINFNDNGCIQV